MTDNEKKEPPEDPSQLCIALNTSKKHAESPSSDKMSNITDLPERIEDWTKEDVRQWLISSLRIPQEYADILFDQDVSGASLVCFEKQDLVDLGVKHGPAIQIIKNVGKLRNCNENFGETSSKNESKIAEENTTVTETAVIEKTQKTIGPVERLVANEMMEPETRAPGLSIQEDSCGKVAEHSWSWAAEEAQREPLTVFEQDTALSHFQMIEDEPDTQALEKLEPFPCNEPRDEAAKSPSPLLSPTLKQCTLPIHSPIAMGNVEKKKDKKLKNKSTLSSPGDSLKETAACLTNQTLRPRPFDKSCPSFTYPENEVLPPETGPSNLSDPIHEFKLLANTANATEKEILKKFSYEVFRFAAACMNRRTNGTIHFGVGDTKEKYKHGQVVGITLTSPDKYIDEFDLRLKEYFEENTSIARACIRPPQFIQVQCPNGTPSDKWVIEVDVVPTYSETQEKLFYTSVVKEEEAKKCKTQCLFIRQGANSIDILADKNPRCLQEKLRSLIEDVKNWASARKSQEERPSHEPKQNHQGQRLKQLITHGRDTLDNSLQFIVVTDKCHKSQLEHLSFLKDLKMFAVLDFDPESEVDGTCSYFRKDRIANIHYPRMYNNNDSLSTDIGKLNLFKQTSWVFCNGQRNEENKADMPFSPNDWLKKRAGEVSDMITFLCNPDVLSKDRLVVMFLIHSAVTDVSSPILETFCAIYRKLEGEDNMFCICKDSAVFSQWRDLVQIRCKMDITSKCIYELNLNEINCTIRKIKEPQTRSSRRYLPSSGSSSVLLTEKDEGLMTVLDVLSENECENTEIETKDSFREFKNKTEEDFYRGGQVTWWNFYLSERPGSLPFIKRDKYEELYNLITPTEGYSSPCVIINLFHHPGCGGTTLAMHALWNLRHKFRCAVLKNNTAQNSEIADQVRHLLTCGKEEQSSYTPVFLLVDNLEDVEDLQRWILCAAHEKKKTESLMVIILNCERSQFPAVNSRNSRIDNVYITNKLSSKEQSFFQVKLKELEVHHEKPETFYAFMIMTNNFSEKYIENLVFNILKDLDVSRKEGQLLSFLALLNTYVNGSCVSLSLCEKLVGIQNLWQRETLEEKMNPYSTLLIRCDVEEFGTYQAVRFLHQSIAKNCLKVLTSKHNLKLSEMTTNLLHCDLLYKSGMGKDILVQNILSMLITRQKKDLGDDKDTLFSPLVEEMPMTEGKEVLRLATERFDKNATVPQALARHFYLKEKNFSSALQWAQDAQQKNYNSYIADTLGQVYKSHLKHEIEHAKELTPELLETYLQLACKAIKAFKDSQELAKKDEPMDCLDQRKKKRQRTYNTSGHVGEMDVAMIIFDSLEDIPFFNKNDGLQWHEMLQFLKKSLPISYFRETGFKTNDEFLAVLTNHERFLVSLKPRMKENFIFFESYFTYLKPRSIERETVEDRNKRKVSEHFKKYVKLFCSSGEEREMERASQPNLSLQQKVEENRCYLEAKRADTFAGLLLCLSEKGGPQMELILKKWQFIFENSTRKSMFNRINFILANIGLHCIKPSSKLFNKYEELLALLNVALQEEGTHSNCTEVYYLAMLLLWPNDNILENTTTYKDICTYVTSTKKSFHRRFSCMFPAKSAIAHFYLGKSRGLRRIIHKSKLDQAFDKEKHTNPHQLWQSGAIWKEREVKRVLQRVKGKTENGDIYVHYGGNLRIPVRPVYLGCVRSGCSMEEVSFYVGFSMEGPVAYDIKYPNDL